MRGRRRHPQPERDTRLARIGRGRWRYGIAAGIVVAGIGIGVGASAYTRNEAVQGRIAQVRASESAAVRAAPSGRRSMLAHRYAKWDADRPKSLRDKRRALRNLRKKGMLSPRPSPTVTHRIFGIIDSRQAVPGMFPRYFYVANQWIGKVDGKVYTVRVGGGSKKERPTGDEVAAVGIFVSRAGISHRIGLYWSHDGVQEWRIVAARDHILTLRGKNGRRARFDVAKRRYI